MFDEDLAIEIGDADRVAVDDRQDLLVTVLAADDFSDVRQREGAAATRVLKWAPADRLVGGGVASSCFRAARMSNGCTGLGWDASAFGVASHAC